MTLTRINRLYWDVPGCNWAVLRCNRVYWAVSGGTGLYLAVVY